MICGMGLAIVKDHMVTNIDALTTASFVLWRITVSVGVFLSVLVCSPDLFIFNRLINFEH